ncbi:hypothetical protein RFI_17378 [Reticulomyxa filosa]|uniref:Uncharacterized protein n=1 Tax=Reticulomyxa filosa TaxID=46433 RepID=X6N278_RETFI|nr:hypothetical protein RFI_17378 [Reticulomyxa filosa]|eukprot:ETO19849.1 hypothetical protein RFI_17378 [Reticulomyxa filosa]
MYDHQLNNLMILFEMFGNRIGRTEILRRWTKRNQVFIDTFMDLNNVCVDMNINGKNIGNKKYRTEEKSDLKIVREMCLHVLWNILTKPKKTKYQQINSFALQKNFKHKCLQTVYLSQSLSALEHHLQEFGFEKRADTNWYLAGPIHLLRLWKCYSDWINTQKLYLYIHICIYSF